MPRPILPEVMKARSGVPTSDLLAMLWAKKLQGYSVTTITGVPPIRFISDGSPLNNVSIIGNGQQTGTPSPDNIIMPDLCGKLVDTNWTIPITCGGQTVTVDLSQAQTVRRIKKIVLDGTESTWLEFNNLNLFRVPVTSHDYREQADGAICDSLPLVMRNDLTTNTFCWSSGTVGELIININNYNLADLKTYLNSNPITIWYVLAEPETAIVNEPLAKIGTYADTLDSANASVTIPTVRGINTLTVDTTLQPSEMSVTGHIKQA